MERASIEGGLILRVHLFFSVLLSRALWLALRQIENNDIKNLIEGLALKQVREIIGEVGKKLGADGYIQRFCQLVVSGEQSLHQQLQMQGARNFLRLRKREDARVLLLQEADHHPETKRLIYRILWERMRRDEIAVAKFFLVVDKLVSREEEYLLGEPQYPEEHILPKWLSFLDAIDPEANDRRQLGE